MAAGAPAPALLPVDWPAPRRVRAFATLRSGAGRSRQPFDTFNLGNARGAAGDDPAAVAGNRAELVGHAGLPSAPWWLRQVHGTRVVLLDQARRAGDAAAELDALGTEPEGDAAVTARPGVVLAVLTADCLPVLLAAADGSRVAAAHAGWRGLAAGILERTVAAMGLPAAGLVAWLGPAAGPAAYEVGSDVRDAFTAHDPAAVQAFNPTRPGHWLVDLYALARARLRDAGLADAAIHGGGLCTISDPARFYSHRRDGRTGRMATLIHIA